MADANTNPSDPSVAEKREDKKKKFLAIVCSQCYSDQPVRRWRRVKITKIWDNPFILRCAELMIATSIAGLFVESSLPLQGHQSLALHTGIGGPMIPIFALFSSCCMLDRNPGSFIVTQILLASSAAFYFLALTVLGINWPFFDINRTKYKLSLTSITSLVTIAFILLLVDFFLAWAVQCCKLSKCCLKICSRKKKPVIQGEEGQPPAH